jgi:hypothetical protein
MVPRMTRHHTPKGFKQQIAVFYASVKPLLMSSSYYGEKRTMLDADSKRALTGSLLLFL